MYSPNLKKVVIVGGGTAGWMAAISLSSHFPQLEIVVIEPSGIPPIGVGESVTGSVQSFINYAPHKLDMRDLFRKADASLKLGIWYKEWAGAGHEYLTPIDGPSAFFDDHYYQDIEDFYAAATAKSVPVSESQIHSPLMRANLTDYVRVNGEVSRKYSMASIHFDAIKFAAWLKEESKSRGNITHVDGQVTGYEMNPETGFINHVKTEAGQRVEGGFFIDCSGFRRILLGAAYEPDFVDFSQHIRVDSAIPNPISYEEGQDVPVYSQATAMPNGWSWRVPTQSRLGEGYLFSSKYVSDEDAINEFRTIVGADPADSPRIIRFKPGKYRSVFCGNVCAIGMAGGFMEALEATTIHIMHVQIKALTEVCIPYFNRESAAELAREHNVLVDRMYADFIDFVSFHYHSGRTDTEFWRDYQKPDAITDRNQERMEMWKHRYPTREDFVAQWSNRFFSSTGVIVWMPMLCGLGHLNTEAAQRHIDSSKFFDRAQNNISKYVKIRNFLRQHAISQREAIKYLCG